jgi:hypothetical protein
MRKFARSTVGMIASVAAVASFLGASPVARASVTSATAPGLHQVLTSPASFGSESAQLASLKSAQIKAPRASGCPSHLGVTFFCDFAATGQTNRCFESNASGMNIGNWDSVGCRNIDESIANNTSEYIRLYFGPNHEDPHTCINPGTSFNNLAGLDFNSGTGAGTPLENNVASSSANTSRCTNPL